jgi:hypothetical protein
MSCGLGAIILVFMLVKYNVDTTDIGDKAVHQEQTDLLEREITQLENREAALRLSIAKLESLNTQSSKAIQRTSEQLSKIQSNLATKTQEAQKRREDLEVIKNKIAKIKPAETSDVIDDQNTGEENYLIGLKVEGQRIAILIDSSSSMTDELLLDVIRRKNLPDIQKKTGPKWQRAKRIVKWLLARLPARSEIDVVSYSGKAQSLGRAGWKSARDSGALGDVLKELDALVPHGPTNLEAGLKSVSRATDVYLITDGLPTIGDSNFRSLNPFAACSALWGRSNRISGACRGKLFEHTIAHSSLKKSTKVNVVLLPIEGDPLASVAYWSWTSATGGLMITPAEDWP